MSCHRSQLRGQGDARQGQPEAVHAERAGDLQPAEPPQAAAFAGRVRDQAITHSHHRAVSFFAPIDNMYRSVSFF